MRRTVRRTIDVAPDNVRWKIVTIVREPVARICSGVLESRNRFFPHAVDLPDEQMFTAIMGGAYSRLKLLDTK